MKTSLRISALALVLSGVTLTGSALASCPAGLQVEAKIDYITVEGAGCNYESYLQERAAWQQEEAAKQHIADVAAKQPSRAATSSAEYDYTY